MTNNRYYSSTALPTTLSSAVTATSGVSISITSVAGLPSSYPYTLLIDWALASQEAITVTAAPTGTGPYTFASANVTRGEDGTTAQTHLNGAQVVHGITARDYTEPQTHMASSSAVHGLAGTVVGTTDAQTLSNKSLAADPTSALHPATKQYVDHRRTAYNVLDYGAVGDGSTDDTTAVQAAITAAVNSGNGGTVYFPTGNYKCTSSLDISSSANVWLEGQGGPASGGTRGSTLTATFTSSTRFINAQTSGGFHMKGLVVVASTGFTGTLVDLTGASSDTAYFTIADCLIKGANLATNGILLNKANDGSIRGTHITGCTNYGILGQLQDGSTYSNGILVSSCVFHVGTGLLAHIGGVGGGWSIQGNVFEDIGTNGAIYNADAITVGNCTGVHISGNWFGDVVGTPTSVFLIAITCDGLSVVGNFMGWCSVDVRQSSNGIRINGNRCYSEEVSAINISSSASNYDLTGNRFFGTDTTKYITPAGTSAVKMDVAVAGPMMQFHNANVASGESRAVARFWSDRSSTQKWDIGIDPAGGTTKSYAVRDATGGNDLLTVTTTGSVILGNQAALATSATDGQAYVPASAGIPTGVPTTVTGKLAFQFDSTNGIGYYYTTAWKALVSTDATQTLTNKTLTTPTIGDLTNAGHSHQNAAGGGAISGAAITSGTVDDARLGTAVKARSAVTPEHSNYIAWSYDPVIITGSNPPGGIATAAIIYLIKCYLYNGAIITGLEVRTPTTTSPGGPLGASMTNTYGGLYSFTGTTATLLKTSADLGASTAATTRYSLDFTGGTYTVTTSGWYYMAFQCGAGSPAPFLLKSPAASFTNQSDPRGAAGNMRATHVTGSNGALSSSLTLGSNNDSGQMFFMTLY